MKADPEQRAVQLGEYIAAHNATVRAAAAAFGCSKSTVHKDVAVRLRNISPALYGQVRAVLARNKAERHLRGGAATRRRYRRRWSPKETAALRSGLFCWDETLSVKALRL